MSYGGESNSKKIARALVWTAWADLWCEMPGKILVLAGPEAADVRALKALGADVSNIIAVDTNPDHIEACRRIEPGATYVAGDAFEYALNDAKKNGRHQYAVVFFDLCQTLSNDLLFKCSRVMLNCLKQHGVLIIGSMYGREGKESLKWIRRKGIFKTTSRIDQAAFGRASYTWSQVEDFLTGSKLLISPAVMLSYRSGRRVKGRSIGVPMLYTGIRSCQLKRHPGKRNWHRLCEEYQLALEHTYGRGAAAIVDNIGDDPDGTALRDAVFEHVDNGVSSQILADVYNLKRQQIAAWKAWRTMREREEEDGVEKRQLTG